MTGASEEPRAELEASEAAAPPTLPEGPRLGSTSSDGITGADARDSEGFLTGMETPTPELTAEDACASSSVEAETIERVVEVPVEEQVVVPSVFYLMLDSSGSMVSDPFTLEGLIEDFLDLFGLGRVAPRPTKWDHAVAGLEAFVNDPASQGLELALGYFPDAGLCDGTGYDVPSVPLGVLPDSAPAIATSLAARVPAGGTPLEGALRGATDFCLDFNAQHPEASCVAVLITDGAPEQCDARSAADLAGIAASAFEAGVLTFAAGMQGADFSLLDAIGQAGGGDCDPSRAAFACDLTADTQAFAAALNGIRDRTRTQVRIEQRIQRDVQILPCEWEIPPAPSGEPLDMARVNVRLSSPTEPSQALSGVPTEVSCGDQGGWFYDASVVPTRIKACPATCTSLRAQPETRIDLLFGCKTILR